MSDIRIPTAGRDPMNGNLSRLKSILSKAASNLFRWACQHALRQELQGIFYMQTVRIGGVRSA